MYNNTGSLITIDSDKTSEFKFYPINKQKNVKIKDFCIRFVAVFL